MKAKIIEHRDGTWTISISGFNRPEADNFITGIGMMEDVRGWSQVRRIARKANKALLAAFSSPRCSL